MTLDVVATPKHPPSVKRRRASSSLALEIVSNSNRRPSRRVRVKSPSSSPELLSSPLTKLALDDAEKSGSGTEPSWVHDTSGFSLPNNNAGPHTSQQESKVSFTIFPSIVDLATPSPPKPRPTTQASLPTVIDLCTPPNLPRKPKEVMDLSTPSPTPRPRGAANAVGPMKSEPKVEAIKSDSLDPQPHGPIQPGASTATRNITISSGPVKVGSSFRAWEEARDAIYHQEELQGFKMCMGQSKLIRNTGMKKKITVRCNHYRAPNPIKRPDIDPSQFREGKSARTECMAHFNVNLLQETGLWNVTLIDNHHNHDPDIPPGGFATRVPSEAQRKLVSDFAKDSKFNRSHLTQMLKQQPGHALEPRQISNMIDKVRREGREEVRALGGDIPSIISALQEKNRNGEGWNYDLQFDEEQVVTGLWWQSPEQAKLARRYFDILINDNTYNRNQYQYPLDIGIAIDNHRMSRNVWYCFHAREDIVTHNWVLQKHCESAGQAPEVICSDRHASLIASVAVTMPTTLHVLCLHHLCGNVSDHLRLALGSQWDDFNRDFWATYRAPSPSEFDRLWSELTTRYPSAASYLNNELHPCREQWAWAWISYVFTAGVRTNGRVEGENRVNKLIGGPKVTFLNLFHGLNNRTLSQTAKENAAVRQVCSHFLSIVWSI